jgi:predicted ArsR family transcriptional regulator
LPERRETTADTIRWLLGEAPESSVGIARRTGLNRPAVAKAMMKLLRQGLVERAGSRPTDGMPEQLYRLVTA